MATFIKGILGGFSGKVGNVVGASFRGLDILKSLPKKNKKRATESQEEQRARFALAIRFLSPFKPFIQGGYGLGRGAKSRFNLAMSYHVREAVIGFMPDILIDYAKVVITKGELLAPKLATAAATPTGKITFAWLDNTGGMSNESDRAVFFVHNPAKQLNENGIHSRKRIDGDAEIELPSDFIGDTVHCWMAFISADDKLYSTSVYLGTVTVV